MAKRINPDPQDDNPIEVSSDGSIELTDAQKQGMILDLQLTAARLQVEAAQAALDKAKASGSNDATETAEIERQTALMRRDITQYEIDEFKRRREEKRANQIAALQNMKQERANREALQAICQHRCGGNGMDDFYRGGHKEPHSIIKAELPIAGMSLLMCVRCFDEVITPDRLMLQRRPTDTDESFEERKAEYVRWMEKYQKFEELFRDSYNPVVMAGPKFQFERDGVPIHPVRV